MFQGTGSDVGKSLIVAGLCRVYARRGLTVRPFKPQNMSNNAAVVPAVDGGDGGEIGRAQALQALAARQPLSVHMNPVLLKPQTDIGAQVVVQGRVRGNAKARDYHAMKPDLMAAVLDSFAIVGADADRLIVEGAGSPAEVNLRAADIANMGFALAAGVPVVLVADIDRGGVIASLVGTWELLTAEERALVRGYVINKFRGDVSLFDSAIDIIRARTGMRCFGVVPHFADARLLPAEDAVALDAPRASNGAAPDRVRIAVPRLPRIANFDDLDPLNGEDGVEVRIIEPGQAIPGDTDVVLIPGSKATLADLAAVRAQGWDIDILAHHRRGGIVVGLCGGYQMLGRTVADPDGIEGVAESVSGLGLLAVDTVIGRAKALRPAAGRDRVHGQDIAGYEMHMGETTGPGRDRPWLDLGDEATDGALSDDGRVMGAYVHGLFAADGFRRAFLSAVRAGEYAAASYAVRVEATLDALADHLEEHLDMAALDEAFA